MRNVLRHAGVLVLIGAVWGCGGGESKLPDGSSPPPDTGTGGAPGNDGPPAADGPSTDGPTSDGPTGDTPVAQGGVQGRVFVAGTGMPVVGATVRTPGGMTATTDAQGIFGLTAVAEGTVVLQAQKASLATTFKPVKVLGGMNSYVEMFLPPIDAQGTVNVQSGGEVRSGSNGARALFPANSLVDSAGNMVQGDVTVTLSSVNPANVEERRAFPGEFRAIRTNSTEVAIETYGPMEISATKDGQPLDLKLGMSAEIAFPIYDPAAPATIELWSLNEETGVWKEEGTAYRTQDADGNPIYQARIGHMSWWNPDKPIERTCIRTCVTQNDQPVRGAMVSALGVGYGYEANAYTGDDGCTSLRVRRGRQVTLHAAAMGGVSPSILVSAPDVAESSDPSACMVVQTLVLAPRPADGCPGGMTKCGDHCVDLINSPNNCGSCDTRCGAETGPDDSTCVMGVCRCASNQVNCNGRCTDPSSDRLNCGGCAASAPVGSSEGCREAACCTSQGLTACPFQGGGEGYYCIDPTNDRYNCGGCGTRCADGQECKQSACAAIVCPTGQTLCENRCIQGPCGRTCEDGQMCSAGSCTAIVCPASLQVCNNSCVDFQRDPRNCGECNRACEQQGAVCNAGTCGCGPGTSECAVGSELTACVNLQADRYNCGICGRVCPSGTSCSAGQCQSIQCPQGQILCGSRCVDVSRDSQHCGGCSATGDSGPDGGTQPPTCVPGQCACTSGRQECPRGEGAACYDLQNDDQNCGDCGNVCESGETCREGACVTITCPQGSVLCGDRCVVGSKCGVNCNESGDGTMCVAGTCQCPQGTQLCQGGEGKECTDVTSDNRNCGGCGVQCQSGFECRQSQCQTIVCPEGRIWCGSACVDTQTDPQNCGGCTPSYGDAGLGCSGEGCCMAYGLASCPIPDSQFFFCTSLSGDPYNCGSCGNACPGNDICREGQCMALTCPTGQVACHRKCVFGTTCGTRCDGETQTCNAGTCQQRSGPTL
jgi:hypothetical protein